MAVGCTHSLSFYLVDFVSISTIRRLYRRIKVCLHTTYPGENCTEVDLVNGNLSIIVSQLTVRSVIALPAWLHVIIYSSGQQSFQVQMAACAL